MEIVLAASSGLFSLLQKCNNELMYFTEGIILRRADAGEVDSLFTIYTKDFGKIRARAQGVKKESAKLKGHLEPLSLSSLSLVSGKNILRLTGASLVNFFPAIRGDFNKLRAAFYIAAVIDEHCFDGEKDENLWRVLTNGLEALEKMEYKAEEIKNFLRSFEEKFLSSLGYHGEKDLGILGSAAAFSS